MAKMKLGGAEYEVDAGLAQAIDMAMKEEKKKGFDECASGMKPKMDSVEAEVATAKKENETLKALIESVRGIHPHAEITVIEDLFQKELVHFPSMFAL